MDSLLIEESVERQVKDFTNKPSHALMLIGPEGSGKGALARQLASGLLGLDGIKTIDQYPYAFLIEPEEGVLTIAAIRRLQEQLRLKTPGTAPIRRIVIIESAHLLTIEAQNAFLKMLEEPPADTVIIMNVVGRSSLLPTVYSRAQQIQVKPIDKAALVTALREQGFEPGNIEKAYYLSEGRIGLLLALLNDDTGHPLAMAIKEAKELLTLPVFERLTKVDALSKQKQDIGLLLKAMQRIAHAALIQASESQRGKDIKRWHNRLAAINEAQYQIKRNANSKLLLSNVLLNL